MPALQNERHELYCKHRARGSTAKKAIVQAGWPVGSNAHLELEKDHAIQERIRVLTDEFTIAREQARVAAMKAAETVGIITGVSKAWVIQQLAQNAIKAAQEGDFKASNEATKLIGDEYGMFKGGSAVEGDDKEEPQVVDMAQVEGLLNASDAVASNEPAQIEQRPEVNLELLERMIGNRAKNAVTAKDRELPPNPETDVAMSDAAEIDDEDEEP